MTREERRKQQLQEQTLFEELIAESQQHTKGAMKKVASS